MKYIYSLALLLSALSLSAQSFDLIRLNRFLEPSVTLSGRYEFETINGQKYNAYGGGIAAAIPLGGHVKVKTDLGKIIAIRDWKDVLGVVSLKASQTFFNLDAEYYDYGFYSENSLASMTRASLGVSGFTSLRKTRFFLWGAKATFAEDLRYVSPVGVRISASGGVATFAKIGLVYYYGAYIAYSDNRAFFTPWLGAQARIPGGFRVKILLPTEAWFSYRFGNPKFLKRSAWQLALGVDSRFFKTGATYNAGYGFFRGDLEYGEFRLGGKVSVDLSKSITFALHGGTSIAREIRIAPPDTYLGYTGIEDIQHQNKRPFLEASLKLNLTKSLFDIDLDEVLF